MITIQLSDIIEIKDTEEEVYEYLSSFSCGKNRSVEEFLKYKSIESEKRHFSRTVLIIDEETESDNIVGYFTILDKNFKFDNSVSGNERKILCGDKRKDDFNTILIAQLGRSDSYKGRVPGEDVLDYALEYCNAIFNLLALRIVCVEFEDNDKLNYFYTENQFRILQLQDTGNLLAYMKLN